MTRSISVLMTCFNRRETTLQALGALQENVSPEKSLTIYLVDDGGTDGTAASVRSHYPAVNVIQGSGSLYWNGGMRLAWEHALRSSTDFYLWLNDDLAIVPGAIDNLLATFDRVASPDGRAIIVGKVLSLDGSTVSYGGKKRKPGLSRLAFTVLGPDESECDTFNGNCVLIPGSAVADVGISSEAYQHSMGDMDYGLRAVDAGYRLYQAPEPVGFQDHNVLNYFKPPERTLRGIVKFLNDPKGMPVKEWMHFCRRHGGWLWPANFMLMFVKILAPK